MLRAVFGLVLLVACVTPDAPASPIERVTGYGAIVAGVGADGTLLSLQWPGPGAPQQLVPPGGCWYILEADLPPQPLGGPGWTTTQDWAGSGSMLIQTRYDGPDGNRRLLQEVGAVPGVDLLVVRLQLQGFPPDTRVAWVQAASPTRFHVPGLARLHRPVATSRERLVQFDPDTGNLVFTPLAPAAEPAGDDAKSVTQVVLGVGTTGDVARGGALQNEADWYRGGLPALAERATGSFPGLLELMPGTASGLLDFTVLIAASQTGDGLRGALQWGRQQQVDTLIAQSGAGASVWLERMPATLSPSQLRPFLNLLVLHEPATGAQLQGTATLDSAPWCDAIASAWVSAALDSLSLHGPAERALEMHLRTVRKTSGPGGPTGSLARRVYASGGVADLRDSAHAESAAWLIAGCLRHVAVLQGEAGTAYAARVWPQVRHLIDFLARDPEVGASLIQGVDGGGATLEQLRVHYLGLEAGRRLGELLGHPEPTAQADRRGEVYARIRFRQMNGPVPPAADLVPLDWWLARWPVPGGGWEGLLQSDAPPFSMESIERLVHSEEVGPHAPLALRDALRLLATAP